MGGPLAIGIKESSLLKENCPNDPSCILELEEEDNFLNFYDEKVFIGLPGKC